MKCSRFGSGFLKYTAVLPIFVIFCALSLVSTAQELMKPAISIPKTENPPLIDGDLSDSSWDEAVVLGDFYIWRGGGETTDNSRVRVVRDDEWLYFAFDVKILHPQLIDVSSLEPDGPIAGYDSVEVFIDPATDGETYLHYMLSAGNIRGERRCTLHGKSVETMWNSPWRSATKVVDTGWHAEIALPLSVFAEHGSLDGMTMNIGVNRILLEINYMGVAIGGAREVSSWAPVRIGFHEPENFGIVKGLEKVKPAIPLLVAAQNVKTSAYQVDDEGGFYYTVSGGIQSFSERSDEIMVMAEDQPTAGKGDTAGQEVSVKGGEISEFSIEVPVTVLSDRVVELTLRDKDTGEVFQSVPLRDMSGLSLMRSYVRYSYYTDEQNAQVVCELGLPEQELEKMTVSVECSEGRVLAETKAPASSVLLPVPIGKLDPGAYKWNVKLNRSNGKTAVVQNIEMIKREPRPGCEWKIDLFQGCLLNNGKPFFPFGIMAQIPSDNEEITEMMSADIADMGFNTVVRWGRQRSFDNLERLLDAGQRHGFYVVEYPKYWHMPGKKDEGFNELRDVWKPGVERVMKHPNLVAYYLFDEPPPTYGAARHILTLHEAVYEVDGYHPTQVLFIPPAPIGPIGDAFNENHDITGVDPYWLPGGGVGDQGTPNIVGRHTWLARQRADQQLKLSWITPCAEHWSGTRMRVFDENEQRVQTYLSLIHGAQGLLYFVYPFKSQVSYTAFKRLGEEMKILGPACVAEAVPQLVRYAPVGFDPANNVFPDIQVSLKPNPEGGYILLAANWRPYPVEFSCKISLLDRIKKVEHLFDKKPALTVADSSFKDTFEPMGTRAYSIPSPNIITTPVEIDVNLKAVPEQTDRFYTKTATPAGGVPGKKNLLPNSGFEETGIPGTPDYYHDIRTARLGQGWRMGDLRGDPGAGICTENPYEGKNSLRLASIPGGGTFFLFYVAPDVREPTPFVFSAWVRTETNANTRISFYGPAVDDKTRTHEVTGEWRRISTTGTALVQPSPEVMRLFGFTVTGTVWIDAMQFELGGELTDYEP